MLAESSDTWLSRQVSHLPDLGLELNLKVLSEMPDFLNLPSAAEAGAALLPGPEPLLPHATGQTGSSGVVPSPVHVLPEGGSNQPSGLPIQPPGRGATYDVRRMGCDSCPGLR